MLVPANRAPNEESIGRSLLWTLRRTADEPDNGEGREGEQNSQVETEDHVDSTTFVDLDSALVTHKTVKAVVKMWLNTLRSDQKIRNRLDALFTMMNRLLGEAYAFISFTPRDLMLLYYHMHALPGCWWIQFSIRQPRPARGQAHLQHGRVHQQPDLHPGRGRSRPLRPGAPVLVSGSRVDGFKVFALNARVRASDAERVAAVASPGRVARDVPAGVECAWRSMAWAQELGLLVAVEGSGSNVVMTSPDGVAWSAGHGAASNAWAGASASTFMAVAASGPASTQVMISPDGLVWTTKTAAASNTWAGLCWSPERAQFLAVAAAGTTASQVMTSPDGAALTARTAAASAAWGSVAWAPELLTFVAVGPGVAMSSPDGAAWASASTSDTATAILQVVYGGTTFETGGLIQVDLL